MHVHLNTFSVWQWLFPFGHNNYKQWAWAIFDKIHIPRLPFYPCSEGDASTMLAMLFFRDGSVFVLGHTAAVCYLIHLWLESSPKHGLVLLGIFIPVEQSSWEECYGVMTGDFLGWQPAAKIIVLMDSFLLDPTAVQEENLCAELNQLFPNLCF